MTKIIELILTEEKIGEGTEESPVRMQTMLYTKTGDVVSAKDPMSYKKDNKWVSDMRFYPENI